MIAITFALPAESIDFRRLLTQTAEELVDGVKMIRGQRHGKSIALVHTGVGQIISEQRIAALLRLPQSFSCVISTGLAGGLSNTLAVGDLFIAENFSNRELLELSRKLLVNHSVRFGTLSTAPTMVDKASHRAALAIETGAVAVDMETEFIARACAQVGIPLLAIRAISDTPLQPFPVPSLVLFDQEHQKTPYASLALYLARHPISAARMVSFVGRISRARKALALALDELLRSDLL